MASPMPAAAGGSNLQRVHPFNQLGMLNKSESLQVGVGGPIALNRMMSSYKNMGVSGNLIEAQNLPMNASGNDQAGGGDGQLQPILQDQQTNKNIPANNQTHISRVSGGEKGQSIEQLKKQFIAISESVSSNRLVELLGGLATSQQKIKAIAACSALWKNLLSVMRSIEEKIPSMSFEDDGQQFSVADVQTNNIISSAANNSVADLTVAAIKEVESTFLNLLTTSSLRFLDTVCTVHDIKYKNDIDLSFDVRQWRRNNLEQIKHIIDISKKPSASQDSDSQTRCTTFLSCCCGGGSNVKEKKNSSKNNGRRLSL